jgi:hypothetical protein
MRRPLMISVEPTMRPPLSAETATAMPERRPVRGAMRRASSARSWAISERRAWNLSGSKESGGASGARASLARRELLRRPRGLRLIVRGGRGDLRRIPVGFCLSSDAVAPASGPVEDQGPDGA